MHVHILYEHKRSACDEGMWKLVNYFEGFLFLQPSSVNAGALSDRISL